MDSALFFPLPGAAPTPTNAVAGDLTALVDCTTFAALVAAAPDGVEMAKLLSLPPSMGKAAQSPPVPALADGGIAAMPGPTVIMPDLPASPATVTSKSVTEPVPSPLPPTAEEEPRNDPKEPDKQPEAPPFANDTPPPPVFAATNQAPAPQHRPPVAVQTASPPITQPPLEVPPSEHPRPLAPRSAVLPARTLPPPDAAPNAGSQGVSIPSAPTPVEPHHQEQLKAAAPQAPAKSKASPPPRMAPAQPKTNPTQEPAPAVTPAVHPLIRVVAPTGQSPKPQAEPHLAAKPNRPPLKNTPPDAASVAPKPIHAQAESLIPRPVAEGPVGMPVGAMPLANSEFSQPEAVVQTRDRVPERSKLSLNAPAPVTEKLPLTQPPSPHELAFMARIDPPPSTPQPDAATNTSPAVAQMAHPHAAPRTAEAAPQSHRLPDPDTPTGTDTAPSAAPHPDAAHIPLPDVPPAVRAEAALPPPHSAPEKPAAPPPSHQAATALVQHLPSQPDRIELTLTPEDLGGLRFEMHRKGDELSIVMSAERPDTLDLMRRQLPDLLAELKQAGVQGGTFSFGTWSDRGHAPQPQNSAAFLAQTEPEAAPPRAQTPPLAQPSGKGLDLRL